MGNIDPLYALYGPDGKRISYGEDQKMLWIDEIRKQFPGIKIEFNAKDTNDYLIGGFTNLRQRGYSMHQLTVGARIDTLNHE